MSENNDSFEPIEKDSLNPVEQSQSAASDEVRNTNASTTDKKTVLSGMFRSWYLEYASYVILERAVPHIEDGLKPVQRRILHSMSTLDDGRFNKVANIVGNTMQYHPHGDASIGDALVQLGQKELLVDTQGNWGNILTGDSAAAPRYIEARLSEFAIETAFSPKITEWTLSSHIIDHLVSKAWFNDEIYEDFKRCYLIACRLAGREPTVQIKRVCSP